MTERKVDSVEFKLSLTNKSDEFVFLPIQHALHSRIWNSSGSQDLIELELGYDLKTAREGPPNFATIKSGQTITCVSKVAVNDEKQYSIKFTANLFMSRRESFNKKQARLEWFALDFKLP
ncbi:MAG TPA: hypothetical protein VGD65_03290 [Chryseosolibacter sp.]